MKVSSTGWLSGVCRLASPNFNARPRGTAIKLLVIHNISLPPGHFSGHAVEHLFSNTLNIDAHPYYSQLKDLKVSAHFFIRRNGTIIQFVSCNKRAWHAGVSTWQEHSACNDFSIGIELEGSDYVPFDGEQYHSLARLTRVLQRHYPIRSIVGHADIAPDRKTDPGPFFDWQKFNLMANICNLYDIKCQDKLATRSIE